MRFRYSWRFWLNYLQTVENQTRRRVQWRLIWVCTVPITLLGVSRLQWVNSFGVGFYDLQCVRLFTFRLDAIGLFVCVEVLRPSQPNAVMSSAASLP